MTGTLARKHKVLLTGDKTPGKKKGPLVSEKQVLNLNHQQGACLCEMWQKGGQCLQQSKRRLREIVNRVYKQGDREMLFKQRDNAGARTYVYKIDRNRCKMEIRWSLPQGSKVVKELSRKNNGDKKANISGWSYYTEGSTTPQFSKIMQHWQLLFKKDMRLV